jgi:nucleoside 2-deoxyribosyltransferase
MREIGVYVGGPIGKMTIQEANQWREEATEYLGRHGIKTYNPLRGKVEAERGSYTRDEIILRDKNDIKKSDIVLVYWPEKCISNGTAMEILYAYEREKIIIFVGEWGKQDIWIDGHVTKFMPDLQSALDYIVAMFSY